MTTRRSAFKDDRFDMWRQAMTLKMEGLNAQEIVERMLELARRDALAGLQSPEILAGLIQKLEAAETIEQVRALTAATRAELANLERLELLAGVDLIQDKSLVPVIDMLIETAFKLGEFENW